MIFKWLRLLCLFSVLCPVTVHAQLKIGVMFFDPPLVFSHSQGFHVALANKLCEGLRETCTIVPMVWNKLFTSLDSREIDLIMGVFITPKRAEKYLFTIPYMPSKGQLIVPTDLNLTATAELKGANVGTLQEEGGEGVFQKYIKATFMDLFTVVEYKDVSSLLTALLQHSIKAGILHATSISYWVANSNGQFKTLGPTFDLGSGYSIMTLPGREALIEQLNKQIQLLKSDGEFNKMYSIYFLDSSA